MGSSPGHAWFRPPGQGAVQCHALPLPHGLALGLHHELRGVGEAVRIHLLRELLLLMNLRADKALRDTAVKIRCFIMPVVFLSIVQQRYSS